MCLAAASYALAASSAVSNVPSHNLAPRLGSRISAAQLPHGRCLTPRYCDVVAFFDCLSPLPPCSSRRAPRQSPPRSRSTPSSLARAFDRAITTARSRRPRLDAVAVARRPAFASRPASRARVPRKVSTRFHNSPPRSARVVARSRASSRAHLAIVEIVVQRVVLVGAPASIVARARRGASPSRSSRRLFARFGLLRFFARSRRRARARRRV